MFETRNSGDFEEVKKKLYEIWSWIYPYKYVKCWWYYSLGDVENVGKFDSVYKIYFIYFSKISGENLVAVQGFSSILCIIGAL